MNNKKKEKKEGKNEKMTKPLIYKRYKDFSVKFGKANKNYKY